MGWKLLILVPLAAYLAIAALMYFTQTAMLFPASQVAAMPPPPGSEPLELVTPSGERLVGLLVPPVGRNGEPLLILGFAGNAWNAVAAAEYLHDLFPSAHVAAFHYRGYAPSGGVPGAEAFQQDALLIHDFVRTRLQPARTVAIGFSVGSGVAAYLAAHRPVTGLILVTPFDSLAEVAADHYPWLPVRWLLRHRLEPADDLLGLDLPVAILAGERDSLVRPARTAGLRLALPNLVFDRTIAGASHNDIYDHPEFRHGLGEGLVRVIRASEE
ncbi:MAG: alpha/beta hydrolase [Sphingosinicella sp.]